MENELHLMQATADMKAFIVAGKALFTVVSTSTAKRYTFKVIRQKEGKKYPGTFKVYLLTGPQNTSDYTGLGYIGKDLAKFTPWANQAETPATKVFGWLFNRVCKPNPIKDFQFWHHNHCGRCGKLLTVPSSIAAGLGPECASLSY